MIEKKQPEVQEAEVVEQQGLATTAPQSVNVTPAQLKKQMTRDQDLRAVLNEYIKNNMKEGVDHGSITVKGHKSKPSLFKPGSEKFCSLLKIRPTFRKDIETIEMLGNTPGIVAYICDLVNSRGQVVGEGRGSSKIDVNGSDFDINKGIKIAEKRAQIDAVLRTGGLSDFFTQDLEDAPKDFGNGGGFSKPSAPSPVSQLNAPKATEKQLKYIEELAAVKLGDDEPFADFAKDLVGVSSDFNLHQASKLIGALQTKVRFGVKPYRKENPDDEPF